MTYRSPSETPLLVVAEEVVALERSTGRKLWEYPLDAAARRFEIIDDRLFVFDGEGRLHCIEIATGRLVGKIDLGLTSPGVLLRDGDRLYANGNNTVVALDRNGAIVWRAAVPPNQRHSLGGLGIPGGAVAQPDYSGK
jgi:outer membrane protein assembly factor BamB